MAFSLISIKACYSLADTDSQTPLNPASECRAIQHKFGETCVPLEPQRIIALDPRITLDPLIALGKVPVGFAAYSGQEEDFLLGVSFDEIEGAANIGEVSQPSLEKIAILKPDLILSADYGGTEQRYDLLSAVAPTVSVPTDADIAVTDLEDKAYFKYNLQYVAKLLGQETKAEEVLAKYQRRVGELEERLENKFKKKEISVIFYGEGYIWTVAKSDIISHILSDIGISHKTVPHGEWNLSIETISEYDADIIFIVDVDKRDSSFYFQNPIFGNLRAVKNNRAYVVSQESWRGFGILGANKILDDLFKYLPDAIETF